jgi:Rad3-related DNA helicase
VTTAVDIDYSDTSIYEDDTNGPLPGWVRAIRPHQANAVRDILAAYERGAEVVFLDAPTGSGKTLIAELVRRRLNTRGVYVCSDKALQRQFIRDFPEAKMLQGRGNYPTEFGPDTKTADDCTATNPSDSCDFCATACPYNMAKMAALGARLAVLNSSYFLAAANFAEAFTGERFVIIDEADTLEDVLLGFIEYKVPSWALHRASMEAPIKAARKPTLVKWLGEMAEAIDKDIARSVNIGIEPKLLRSMRSFVQQTRAVQGAIQRDIDAGTEAEDAGKWIRVYEDERSERAETLHMKPVLVQQWGARNLWRHAKRWLLMSGTIISSDEMVETLGLPFDYETVQVAMTFPVEHRPVVLAPIADMTFKAGDSEYRKMAYAIQQVCAQHDGDRVLVHTVSAKRAERIMEWIEKLGGLGKRRIVSYRSARERDSALDRYLKYPNSILFAQSMDRGIDLPGEACRVQIIAKVPFMSLGDRRVSARMHLPGGEDWYRVQAIRSVVQMTGRGVRSADDWATTYIFDAQFGRNLWRPPTRSLFPAYWQEAVDRGRDVRQFIEN